MDNGIGIPNDKLDIIFEEFRQVDEGQGRNFEGVGLGLTIAKKYIEKLGGNISVTSTLGIGSTFKLSFPSSDEKIKETVSALSQEINTESNPKILVVEDDEINVRVVKLFLRRTTKFVDVANSGEEALSLVKQNKYDVILMDINLGSGIDGVQTTTEIRKIDGYKSTPIIAVTAYAYDDDKNSFLSKGFSNYLAKPYNGKDLLNMIKNELVAHNK